MVGAGLLPDSTSWKERLAAAAYQLGGWDLADIFRLGLAAVPWFLAFLILFTAASMLKKRARTIAFGLVGLLWLGVSVTGIWRGISSYKTRITDTRLLAPTALVEMAKKQGGRVFVNVSARPQVAVLGQSLLDSSLPLQRLVGLSLSPEKWRMEDRAKPFSAVLLGGQLSEAKPLIRHLLDAPDWYLARVDNQGLLFLRGEKPDLAATPVPEFKSPRDRAVYLAQYALNLEAAGFRTLAVSSMEEARNLAGKDYEILFRSSSLAASLNLWEHARKQAAAAAKARPGAFEADYLLALSFLETRAFEKAFDSTSKLKRKYPNDPNVLLLHARAARAVHDFSEETATLEKLLDLAKQNNAPTARIHIYLAQSWAQRGFPEQAVSHYQAALDGGLSPAEASDVRAALGTIQENRLKK